MGVEELIFGTEMRGEIMAVSFRRIEGGRSLDIDGWISRFCGR
jgi:hypothetical protein